MKQIVKNLVLHTLLSISLILGACGGDSTTAASADRAITGISLNGTVGTIDEAAKSIVVTVPFGTDVTRLVATYTTTGASVAVAGKDQISGVTQNDFTSPLVYTVTAADASTVDYTVTVTESVNMDKVITGFELLVSTPHTGVIDEAAKSIAVTVPNGTQLTGLIANFTVSSGASVAVAATPQISGTTANDFTLPVVYTVTAADGSMAVYTVTVTVSAIADASITSYSLNGSAGSIDQVNNTIAVTVPFGTDVTNLIGTFSYAGNTVYNGAVLQLSRTTANNFTAPITLDVVGTLNTKSYTVSVSVSVSAVVTPSYTKTVGIFKLETNGTYTDLNKDLVYTVGATCETWTRNAPGDAINPNPHLHYNAQDASSDVGGAFTWTEYGPEHDQATIDATCAAGVGGVVKTVDAVSYLNDKGQYLKLK